MLTVTGLLLRPVSIGAAVVAFLLAVGLFGLATGCSTSWSTGGSGHVDNKSDPQSPVAGHLDD